MSSPGDESPPRKGKTTMTTAAAVATNTAPVPTWTLDASHSHVGFSVRHMMISNVRGEFGKVSGTASYDPERPEQSRVEIKVDIASINTREEKRDAHLRSADFFDAEKFPTMDFVSKTVQQRGDKLSLVGDLTIRGTTKEVTLEIEEITPTFVDPWGNLRVGASGRTKIRRSDFGMKWNAALEAGGVLVGDDVTIQIEVELMRSK
jgi:polyisoprenoid-binding protein YceI